VEDACRAAIDEISNNGNRVHMTMDLPPGKVEVVLEYKPLRAPEASSRQDLSMRARVDSVSREMTNDGTRITLQKKVKRLK